MTPNARVHKHREKLRGEQCRRLEVWIGGGVIDNIRHLAKVTNRSTWDVVQDALKVHLVEYRQVLAEGQRLRDERARVLKLVGISAYQPQIIEYNRQLATYNERLSRFQGGDSP